MKHRLDWEREIALYATFTHLRQQQLARPQAAATALFPALAWATASLDSEVTGADAVHVHESAATCWVQVVAFQVPK
jgi:hypothetical protein